MSVKKSFCVLVRMRISNQLALARARTVSELDRIARELMLVDIVKVPRNAKLLVDGRVLQPKLVLAPALD